ncbi:M43 family zinc metalloprotease [Flavihumibacter fluvii]|uniref:M43 family zinc metalloprotease n=1 Tax=Flavihumibacter fluvii TaxID=2838157 RepID=UPI001BDE8309|nr:M43 family zinc metalloprotease [Flavihumibacter fluvii]ULQ54477.1 T9SS type A sorting domain-containing protein [Flavihumibacter fluvii]
MRRTLSVLYFILLPVLLFSQKECRLPKYFQVPESLVPAQIATTFTSPILAFNTEIVIPVVIHILTTGSGAPISVEQVNSQIAALNRDYNAENEDRKMVPSYFKDLVANCRIRFELAKVDPSGLATTGIVYKKTSRNVFGLDDEVKFSAKGGDDAWPRDQYLNVWVCPMISSVQGYSTSPGAPAELDGVVLNQTVFGTLNKSGENSMGRIAVHEIGHWLGLKHIWGDGYCGDDEVDDTPMQKSYNSGCPSGIIQSCGNELTGDMYMNYMDLTNDACMFMFTEGQKKRMHKFFEPGNYRYPILSSAALGEPGHTTDPNWGKPTREQLAIRQLKVFPVPASVVIRIDLSGFPDVAGKAIMVYNMAGQVMMSSVIRGKQLLLDVSSLASGQYLLKIAHSTIAPAKFVKL